MIEQVGRVPLLALRLPAAPVSVPRIRRDVCAFAAAQGAGGILLDDLALAVTEAAANVVRHAYPGREDGVVEVVADVEEGTLEIVVSDEGSGFRAGRSEGLGAGLSLIAGCTASFGIESGTDGAELWMRFLLPRAS